MKINKLRGTRDFYPKEMILLNYIFSTWKDIAEKFGYEEVDGPLLEPVDLWTLKSGSEIPEQMYNFKDKSGREVAIRPEFTPTIARLVAQKQKGLIKPIKWYSIPRCWRYEAPQSGRLREFFQFNIDCLGTTSMMADAEIIITAIEIMKKFGCTEKDFYIRLNNRKLIASLFSLAGIKKKQLQEVCRLIDKKDKLMKDDFELSLKDLKLNKIQIDKIKTVLDYDLLNKIDEASLDNLGKQGYNELKGLLGYLKKYKKYIKLDFSIMRGFDYYTSTVFEIFDKSNKFRAIAGGGRYENLVKDFGGESCPGVGYGMGDVVISLFLEQLNKLPELNNGVDFYIAPIKDVLQEALNIAIKLRKKYSVNIDLMGRSLRKQLDYANSIKAKKVIIVGSKDLAKKQVTVRDMVSGKEKKIKVNQLS
ncbi:MAG: histidine--tRNA ligase [Nanoarchaeota archaeon]|nr:histidine--tRNA ligase [Nanoarchaeota archaeon]